MGSRLFFTMLLVLVSIFSQSVFAQSELEVAAQKASDEGRHEEAIAEFREAIAVETDSLHKADLYFSVASILFKKLYTYEDARTEALRAAALRPDWGLPFALIGDMYAHSARWCGDSWHQSLAVLAAIEKWNSAKKLGLDESMTQGINRKIATHMLNIPSMEEGFLRGVKPGSNQTVGCWINEKVKVRYKK